MSVKQYRKKPVVIEAMQFDGSRESAQTICDWANSFENTEGEPWITYITHGEDGYELPHDLLVETLEGHMSVSEGDFVIKGVQGEFYPCKPDIFEASYDAVEEPEHDHPYLLGEKAAEGCMECLAPAGMHYCNCTAAGDEETADACPAHGRHVWVQGKAIVFCGGCGVIRPADESSGAPSVAEVQATEGRSQAIATGKAAPSVSASDVDDALDELFDAARSVVIGAKRGDSFDHPGYDAMKRLLDATDAYADVHEALELSPRRSSDGTAKDASLDTLQLWSERWWGIQQDVPGLLPVLQAFDRAIERGVDWKGAAQVLNLALDDLVRQISRCVLEGDSPTTINLRVAGYASSRYTHASEREAT